VRLRPYLFELIAVLAVLAVKFLTPPPPWIEAHYSNGLYPPIDTAVRAVTAPLPFTLGDVLLFAALIGLVVWWIGALRRAPRGRRLARVGRLALRTLAFAAVIFVWFAVSWAFNYSRVPLADKIPLHLERTNEDAVNAFADHVVDELNRNVAAAHKEHPTDLEAAQTLLPRFNRVIERLGDRATFAPPRIKPTIFQRLFEMTATTGFSDPWTHEVNLDASSFFYERPAIYAHEWAHISGFADESEANLISALACTTSNDALLRYSGWILTWENLGSKVHFKRKLKRQAYNDLRAIRARFLKNVRPEVERVSRNAYDSYLKANRVKAGFNSYQLFVRWLTAADFDRDGLPIVRPATGSE
jgi:hypothetical protein